MAKVLMDSVRLSRDRIGGELVIGLTEENPTVFPEIVDDISAGVTGAVMVKLRGGGIIGRHTIVIGKTTLRSTCLVLPAGGEAVIADDGDKLEVFNQLPCSNVPGVRVKNSS